MYCRRLLILLLVLASGMAMAQQPKDRLLVLEHPDAADLVPAPRAIPRSYALVIGISEYPNLPANRQLLYGERDAEAIYRVLISPEGGNFRAENVHLLLGREASLAHIRHELEEWLVQAAAADDRVVIYFAGHGFVVRGNGYLAPADFDPRRPAETGYPMETLGRLAGSGIKARWKVLLTDACHSGAITPESDPQAINRSLLDLNASLFSLTASRDREPSRESADLDGGHGVFTYYLVKGLQGEADESCDGVVTADELAEYVRVNVRNRTKGAQNPTSDRGSFDPKMLLAYNPSRVCAAPRPLAFGSMVIESNMDGVEVFVDDESVGTVGRDKPLTLPGLKPGPHTVKAVKMGYEPDGPREEMIFPGQATTVSVKIRVRSHHNKAAIEHFDAGVKLYQKGYEAHYKKAVEQFQKALELDAKYSEAAMYLARSYAALYQPEEARRGFQRALKIDPDFTECRVSYAGLLLDLGDMDESIRQLTPVLQSDKRNALAQCMLAQAQFRKDLFTQAAASAERAIAVSPGDPEPHFWLAEALRLGAAAGKDPRRDYERARAEYMEYLRRSDFDSKLAGKLNYYVRGFLIGRGRKSRAAEEDIWKDLRSIAYAGLGDCERLSGRPQDAIAFYQRALHFDSKDPLVHFSLAVTFTGIAEQSHRLETLPSARSHFETMLALNADLEESQRAKQYVARIDSVLESVEGKARK